MRKPDFCLCENKAADQLRSNFTRPFSTFVFAKQIEQLLFDLYQKFQKASSPVSNLVGTLKTGLLASRLICSQMS